MAWALFYWNASYMPTCPYLWVTGDDCLFCGGTRAFSQSTHGHFKEAFALNLLWPLYAGIFLSLSSLSFYTAYSGHFRYWDLLRTWGYKCRWLLILICLLVSLLN